MGRRNRIGWTWWVERGWKTFGKIMGAVYQMGAQHFPKQCNDESCTKPLSLYRQCPDKACAKDIGYCKEHGGDDRALEEMQQHLKKHYDKDVQS